MNNTVSTICLNMIVKNEKHIIKETLDNICSKINFNYWVISDTGSTDGTQEVIIEYFKQKNIPGELFNDEWRDFSYNRNLAIQYAFDKSDYLFFFDADDLINGDLKLNNKLTKDVYKFKFGSNIIYSRNCLIKNREKIGKYVGVLHEVFVILKNNCTVETIQGNYWFESRRLGDRSKNPDKYKKDGKILELAFNDENTDLSLKHRYAYYCGQSYRDAKLYQNSINWFEKYLELHNNNNNQYKYCACINLGMNYKYIKNTEQSLYFFGLAYKYDSTRIEGITYIMQYFYDKKLHFIVNALWNKFKYYKILNSNDKIFLNNDIYRLFELYNMVSGFYSGDFDGAYESCKRSIINNFNIPLVIHNLIFYKEPYKNDSTSIVKEFLYNYIKDNLDFEILKKYSEFLQIYDETKYNLLLKNLNKSIN